MISYNKPGRGATHRVSQKQITGLGDLDYLNIFNVHQHMRTPIPSPVPVHTYSCNSRPKLNSVLNT